VKDRCLRNIAALSPLGGKTLVLCWLSKILYLEEGTKLRRLGVADEGAFMTSILLL